MNTRTQGQAGEDLASLYLQSKQYHIIQRNYRCRHGEIDIICLYRDQLVFVEVKSRKNDRYGYPSEFVGWKQQNRIIRAAEYYVICHNLYEHQFRFDVIEIYSGEGRINHIENAFP